MTKAVLSDGRVLNFPDGTDPKVIQSTVKKMMGQQPIHAPTEEMSGPQQALRAAEFGSRGFLDSAAETIGAVPELAASGLRSIGLPAPDEGYYPEAIKGAMKSFGQTISAPANALLDGGFGPNTPQTGMDRAAYGTGRGAADAASFMLPAAALAKTAKAGSLAQKSASVMASQPILQVASGAAGGGVQEATGNKGLGLATALAVPTAAGLAKKAVTPFASQLSGNAQQLAQKAQQAGIPLTPGQATGSPVLRRTEQAFAQLPFTAGPQGAAYDAQRKAFNSAVLGKAGISADEASPQVIDAAFVSIGKEFDNLAKATVIKGDAKLVDDIKGVAEQYGRRLTTDVKPVFQSYVDDFNDMQRAMNVPGSNVQINGTEYQAMSSDIKAAARSAGNNPGLQTALNSMAAKLDDALERSSGAELRDAWKEVRNRYRNLLTVDSAAAAGRQADRSNADIPFAGLTSAVRRMDKSGYGRGRGDLNELSRVGDFLGSQKIPDPGSAGMAGTLLALTGGGGGLIAGADPAMAMLGASAGLATPKLLQMAYQNPVIAKYLMNQVASSPSQLGPMLGKVGMAEQLGEAKRTGQDPYLLRTGR